MRTIKIYISKGEHLNLLEKALIDLMQEYGFSYYASGTDLVTGVRDMGFEEVEEVGG